jgi:sensor histidine kinase YesM
MIKTARADVFKHRIALFLMWMLPIPIVLVVTVLFSRSISSLKTDNMLVVSYIAEYISGALDSITGQFSTVSGLFPGEPLLIEYGRDKKSQRPELQILEMKDEYRAELENLEERAAQDAARSNGVSGSARLGIGGGASGDSGYRWYLLEESVFPVKGVRNPDRQEIILASVRSTHPETGKEAMHYLVIPEPELYAIYLNYVYHQGPTILILDEDNRILSSSDPYLQQMFGTVFEREICTQTVMVSTVHSRYTGWQTVIMMPSEVVTAPMMTLYRNLITAIIIIIFIVIAVSFFVNYHFVKKEKHNRDLEIKVLMGQINPHVIYNSLETIVWKANQAKLPDIARIASQIGMLMRLSITSSDTMKTLEQVIHHLRIYVNVEKIRYKEKLEFEILPFPDEFLDYKVPPLLLQPCVENAVMHGMKPGATVLHIKLLIEQRGKNLFFRIDDDGSGIKSEKLEKVRKGQYFETRGSRIGIKNIQERLRIFFGKDYGLTIESVEGEGTTVMVKVPVRV